MTNWSSRLSPLRRDCFAESSLPSVSCSKMSCPLDSESERIFSDDDSVVRSCGGSTPKQATNGACSTSGQTAKTPKRRRILPAMFDSSGEEESDEENSRGNDSSRASSAASTPTTSSTSHQLQSNKRVKVNETPVCEPNKSTRSLLEKILLQQDEILKRIKALEKKEKEKEETREEKIYVPPSIRNAIRDGYSDGLKRGYAWIFDKKKQQDDENTDMTSHILMFVKGWNSDVEERVIHCGIKRYFISKKQEAVLKSKNKLQEQKQKRVLYERKKEKAKRRKQALDRLASRVWENEMRRTQVRNILKVEFTSSDEECDGGFITHPISWQSDKLTKVKSHLDKTFLEICSVKSKRMLQSRSVGAVNIKPSPTCPEVFPWMVKKD
ncbi:uncharacterized protein LOC133187167 [Saccostrea echinata]|uniref:uncharacterized protein LOC133187167 n=1 Tax=Saccostrea echinata TaxID=191078 RepID=UPI002A80E43E|nr:uncharacterized protein LOC133187167 [Saccostrea echinata]